MGLYNSFVSFKDLICHYLLLPNELGDPELLSNILDELSRMNFSLIKKSEGDTEAKGSSPLQNLLHEVRVEKSCQDRAELQGSDIRCSLSCTCFLRSGCASGWCFHHH